MEKDGGVPVNLDDVVEAKATVPGLVTTDESTDQEAAANHADADYTVEPREATSATFAETTKATNTEAAQNAEDTEFPTTDGTMRQMH